MQAEAQGVSLKIYENTAIVSLAGRFVFAQVHIVVGNYVTTKPCLAWIHVSVSVLLELVVWKPLCLDPSDGVFGRFDLAALCGCHTLNVCCCCRRAFFAVAGSQT